jgi:2-dehydropantoate 2-reductase
VRKVNIGIIGLGGIGGLLAILLKNKNFKVFTSKKIKKNHILYLKSKFYGNLKSKIEFEKTLKKTDIIFICSKYPYLKKHLKFISNNKALIVPFLNGLLHFKILQKKFGKNLLTSTIGKVVSKKNKNIIIHESKNKPEVLINFNKTNKNKQKTLLNIFKIIQVKIKVIKNRNNVIWSKLIRLSAISAITSLYNCNLGKIRKSKIKSKLLDSLLIESIKLSKKIFKNNFSIIKVKKIINTFPNELTTSLQRDINLNTHSELETQIGSIVKLSSEYKVSVPTYEKIYLKLKKNEKK